MEQGSELSGAINATEELLASEVGSRRVVGIPGSSLHGIPFKSI
jgi:hypothetical protein